MSNEEKIKNKLGNLDTIQILQLPNFVRKDGLLCNGSGLSLCNKENLKFNCDNSECLMPSEEKIYIDYNTLNYKLEDSIKDIIKNIHNKINIMNYVTFNNINSNNDNSETQKEFSEKNNKIRNKLESDLSLKKKIFDNKTNNFRIEYNKIEELNNNIEKNKKIISKYLEILKYLIPILILIIIFFIIFQSNFLFN